MESSRIVRRSGVSAPRDRSELYQSKTKSVADRASSCDEWRPEPKLLRFFLSLRPGLVSGASDWSRLAGLALILLVVLIPLWMCSPAISQMTPELKEALELHKAGKVKEAVDVYSEVIKKNQRSAEALNWRGMAYDDLGQLDDALADYNAAIDLSSNYADAYNNRGEIYRKQKKYAEALADYKKAAELEKGFPEAHYNMALVNELQQRKEQAVAEYGIYLRLKPDAPDRQQITDKIQALKQAIVKDRMAAGQVKPGAKQAPPKFGAPGMPAAPKAPGVDLGIPGVPPLPIPTDVDKLLAGMDIASSIFSFLFYVFTAAMLYLIASKTGTSLPWLAFIPIANIFLMVKIARKPLWWMALLFLPVVAPLLALLGFIDPTGGIIVAVLVGAVILVTLAAWLLVSIGIAQARGKSVIWGILLFIPCTYLIALGYLGLSK